MLACCWTGLFFSDICKYFFAFHFDHFHTFENWVGEKRIFCGLELWNAFTPKWRLGIDRIEFTVGCWGLSVYFSNLQFGQNTIEFGKKGLSDFFFILIWFDLSCGFLVLFSKFSYFLANFSQQMKMHLINWQQKQSKKYIKKNHLPQNG